MITGTSNGDGIRKGTWYQRVKALWYNAIHGFLRIAHRMGIVTQLRTVLQWIKHLIGDGPHDDPMWRMIRHIRSVTLPSIWNG